MEILACKDVSFSYPESGKKAIDNLNFSVNAGDFVVICGESGCGKTTLLRLLKRELAPAGDKSGEIFYMGTPTAELDDRVSAGEIGFVMQNPEHQLVTDKVWHELAFGLENLGVPTATIRRRVGEMASFFGIQTWFRQKTSELSGGQKQLLNLAAIMVMQPKVLILDEPTSQLDPIAAAEFIATLQKINKELGLTILLVEHRLEEVFPIADKVAVMEAGQVILFDTPRNVGVGLRKYSENHNMLLGLPCALRIFRGLGAIGECPLTVRDGRNYLDTYFADKIHPLPPVPCVPAGEKALEVKDIWFRYEKDLPDIVRGVSFEVYRGETFTILGGNGTGKTTLLSVISGQRRAYSGKLLINGKSFKKYKGAALYRHNLAYLPQNPQTVFLKHTLMEDFGEVCKGMDYESEESADMIASLSERLGIAHLLEKHPYDLSGGEQQKAALCKILLLKPKILLLDEPTKGIDAFSKHTLGGILRELKTEGITILLVTHDVEFAAAYSDRCAMFFDGEITSVDRPREFFSDNNFYTTAASRISRHLVRGAILCEEVVAACKEDD